MVFVFASVAMMNANSNVENPIKGQITIETQVKDKSNEKITFTINFDSIADLEKFDFDQNFSIVDVESCTACIKIEIAGSGAEVCATAETCARAVGMLKELIKII